MPNEEKKPAPAAQPAETPPAKKTYTPPQILFLAPLESTADVCDPLIRGKASGSCVMGES